MSNLPKLPGEMAVKEPTSDFSDKDLVLIKRYVEDGLPGVATLDSSKLQRIMDLYLSGKTYRQISNVVRVEKPLILYLSQKFNWYTMRREYLHELEVQMRHRVIDSKLMNQDFLLQLQHMYQSKIGDKIVKYLATGDASFANEIDPKEVAQYLKVVESLHKLNGDPKSSDKPPAVGLNLGDGVTIKKVSDTQVEITPKETKIGDMLKQFADFRRNAENKEKTVKNADINNETLEGEEE